MKIVITHHQELVNPHLEIDLNLENGANYIAVKHRCPDCAGYGCKNGACNDTILLKPEAVADTLGPEAAELLGDLFRQILG